LKQTARGYLLLESAKGTQPRAVAGENAFFKKQLVGKVFDSIANVDQPFYLMRIAQGVDAKTLLGKTLETKK
jgi:rRNA processing protein Gar1